MLFSQNFKFLHATVFQTPAGIEQKVLKYYEKSYSWTMSNLILQTTYVWKGCREYERDFRC